MSSPVLGKEQGQMEGIEAGEAPSSQSQSSGAASSERDSSDKASAQPEVTPELPSSQGDDLPEEDARRAGQQSSKSMTSTQTGAPSPSTVAITSTEAPSTPIDLGNAVRDDSSGAPSLAVEPSLPDDQPTEIPMCEEQEAQTDPGNNTADMEGLTLQAPSILEAMHSGTYCDVVLAFEKEFADRSNMQLPADLVTQLVLREKQEDKHEDDHHQEILQICKFLTSRTTIPFDFPDADRRTPLSYAAAISSPDLVNHLLEVNAEVNTVDVRGETPLLIAAGHGRAENVRLLIAYSAEVSHVNRKGETALHLAAAGCHLQTMVSLLQMMSSKDVNAADNERQTALFFAGSDECCELLLDHNADLNQRDIRGQSALFAAARRGCLEMCRQLVERGCDIHIADANGRTALFEAVISGQPAICEYFVDVMFTSINENTQCQSMCSRLLGCKRHWAAREQAQELGLITIADNLGLLEEVCTARLSKQEAASRRRSMEKDASCQNEEAGRQVEKDEQLDKGRTSKSRSRSVARQDRLRQNISEQHQASKIAEAELARKKKIEEYRKVEEDMASRETAEEKERRIKRSEELMYAQGNLKLERHAPDYQDISRKFSAASSSAVADRATDTNNESWASPRSRERSRRRRKRSRWSNTPSPEGRDQIDWYVLRVEDCASPPGQAFLPIGSREELEAFHRVQVELAASTSQSDVVLARFLTRRNCSRSACEPPASLAPFQMGFDAQINASCARRCKPRPRWKREVFNGSLASAAAPDSAQSQQDCSNGQEGRSEDALAESSLDGSVSPKKGRSAEKYEAHKGPQSKAAREAIPTVYRGAKTVIKAEKHQKIDIAADIEEVAGSPTFKKEQHPKSPAQSSAGSPYTGYGEVVSV